MRRFLCPEWKGLSMNRSQDEMTEEEIVTIAEVIGCDPEDLKCVALLEEVVCAVETMLLARHQEETPND